jgi:hypothetical protein
MVRFGQISQMSFSICNAEWAIGGWESGNAKAHPAEDFAESFSTYLYERKDVPFPESARSKMGEAKWQYLVKKHPEKLKREL